MKKLSIILGLAFIMGASPVLASTPCSGKSVASTTYLNWNNDSGIIHPGEVFHSNNYYGTTPNGTECGNLFIFAETAGAGSSDYPTSCDQFYEPNIYRKYAHQCETDTTNNQNLQNGDYNNILCKRNEHKACTLPKK